MVVMSSSQADLTQITSACSLYPPTLDLSRDLLSMVCCLTRYSSTSSSRLLIFTHTVLWINADSPSSGGLPPASFILPSLVSHILSGNSTTWLGQVLPSGYPRAGLQPDNSFHHKFLLVGCLEYFHKSVLHRCPHRPLHGVLTLFPLLPPVLSWPSFLGKANVRLIQSISPPRRLGSQGLHHSPPQQLLPL